MFPVILILRNRKIELTHLMLLSGFFIMSIKASRYGIFYAVVGTMIMGKEFNALINDIVKKRVSGESYRKIEYGLAIVTLISVVLFTVGYSKHLNFRFERLNPNIPESAVSFIERNRIQGNIFNDYGYGGYITWRLYPQKNFIDTRALNYTVMDEYKWTAEAYKKVEGIKTTNDTIPLWEALLNHYKINYVFIPIMDLYGTVFPLTLELALSDKWELIYIDKISIIFIRNKADNSDIISKFKLSKDDFSNALIARFSALALEDRINPRHVMSLGYIFLKLGRHADAIKAYKYALERWKDPYLEKKIKEIDEEFLKQKKLLNAPDAYRK